MLRMIVETIHAKANGHTGGGSLGLGNLRYDPASNRVKGFCGRLLTPDTLGSFREEVAAAIKANPLATRLTARALARNELLPKIREIYENLFGVGLLEASIPVDNHHSIVYVGRNTPIRFAPENVRFAQMAILKGAQEATPVSMESALGRVRGEYRLATLDSETIAPHVDSLVDLFSQAYPKYLLQIDRSAVLDMVSGENIFFAALRDDRICSVLVAEHGIVHVEGYGNLVLRELSEYATDNAHGGKGLNIALQHLAINTLRSSGEPSVIFAEGRAPWHAVIRSMVRAGLQHGGTLNQHCTLVAIRDAAADHHGDYEDLHVFYPVRENV